MSFFSHNGLWLIAFAIILFASFLDSKQWDPKEGGLLNTPTIFFSRKAQDYMLLVSCILGLSAISMLIWGFARLKWYAVICDYILGGLIAQIIVICLTRFFGSAVRYLLGMFGWMPTVATAIYCWFFESKKFA